MYTQCPDCGTSFRVTAEVLKQAGGKVRCGGCSNAFNALAYLSESKPDAPVQPPSDESLPELQPDTPAESTDAPPTAISPEQSAALLKTLDQLAGDEIRLEDTGVEWRLMDDEDENVDEMLDDSPTPIDEFLTKTPTEVESGEIFENADEPAPQSPAEELRFDDNTGLPDDFDLDDLPAAAAPPPEPDPEPVTQQVDLAFGEPEEWGELLQEVDTSLAESTPTAMVPQLSEDMLPTGDTGAQDLSFEEELAAIPDDPAVRDPGALESELEDPATIPSGDGDEDAPPDIDTQFDIQAEAMGIDISGIHETAEDDESIPDSTGALEIELAEAAKASDEPEEELTSIDDDLIAAAFEKEQAAATAASNEFDIEAEVGPAEGNPGADDPASAPTSELDEAENDEHPAMAEFAEPEIELDAIDSGLEELVAEGNAETEFEDIRVRMDDEPPLGETEHEIPEQTEEEKTVNMQIDAELMAIAVEDEDGFASTIVIEDKTLEDIEAEALGNGAAAKSQGGLELSDDDDIEVEIDLLDSEAELDEPDEQATAAELPFDENDPGIETIVMEGDVVEAALNREKAAAELAASEPVNLSFLKAAKRTMRGKFAANEDEPEASNSRRYGMIAAIVVLAILLVVQFVHQSRTALATVPTINDVIAPLYRAAGSPITPEWDVTGWRFEVTKGSTNPQDAGDNPPDALNIDEIDPSADIVADENEVLTIYSRIGNKSDGPLPYPLISVALTDRFEETIGNIVLEPADYLAGNPDPRIPVPPGNTFNAVISIESPSPDATGFKLNVCYRHSGDLLRCAIEDFK